MSSRVAPPYVQEQDLRVGGIYFSVSFSDQEFRVPIIDTYEYTGSAVENGKSVFVYKDLKLDPEEENDLVGFEGFTGVRTLSDLIVQLQNLQSDLEKGQT